MILLIPLLLVAATPRLSPTTAALLRIESGAMSADAEGTLLVRDPSTRAVVPGTDGKHLKVAFTYLGPTEGAAPLASGELRRQLGLKLQAQDPCNVVYVTWRIPDGIHVQVKTNPGQGRSSECRDNGYRTVRAELTRPAPVIRVGEPHTLSAAIDGGRLVIEADGTAVWQGMLPQDASALEGPVGLRTDNAQFRIKLWTVQGT